MAPGHLGLLIAIAAATIWYIFDTTGTSMHRNNILLVLPLGVIVLLAVAFETTRGFLVSFGIIRAGRAAPPVSDTENADAQDGEHVQSVADIGRGIVLLALTGLLVFTYQRVGFDVAVFVFQFVALHLLGPGKTLAKLIFAAIFTVVTVGGAKFLLSYPMPTLFL